MRIRKILSELVENAAEEIGYEFNEGCVVMVEEMLWVNHGIFLNNEKVVTQKLMRKIYEEVKVWKENTEQNYI